MSRIRRAAPSIALMVASTLFALGGAECAFRIALPGPRPWLEPQVAHEHVPRRVTADGGVAPEYFYLRPNQKAHSLDVSVETNSLGLRGPEVPQSKPPGTFRVLALGDSHTFGLGVPESESWPRLLEGELRSRRPGRPIEVVNGGVQSLAIEQEVQLLQDRLLPLTPDLVVLAYYWNDMPMAGEPEEPLPDGTVLLPSTLRHGENTTVMHTDATGEAGGGGATSPRAVSRGAPVEWIRATAKKSYLFYWVVQRVPAIQMRAYPTVETLWKRATLAGRMTPRMEASWHFVEAELTTLRRLGMEHGFEVVVLVIPLFEQMTTSDYPTTSYQDQLLRICAPLGIPVVDPLSAIRADRPTYERSFIPFDGHPKGEIYRRIAEVLSERLIQNELYE